MLVLRICMSSNFKHLKYSPEGSFDLKGKRKKHHGSDSSSSGGEISDLVQKLADKVKQCS